MLTVGQEKAFDAYFEAVERVDLRWATPDDKARPCQLLQVVHCALGRVSGKRDAVTKYLVDHDNAELIDIHRATGLNEEELTAILRRDMFTIQRTPRGCRYGLKLSVKTNKAL